MSQIFNTYIIKYINSHYILPDHIQNNHYFYFLISIKIFLLTNVFIQV